MLETPHVAFGIALATKIPNPWISIPLAFGSHFVLDKITHWNPHTYTETATKGAPSQKTVIITIVDISFALIIGLGAAYTTLPNYQLAYTIIACSFASVLPDVSKYPFFLFKNARRGLYKKWVDFERSLQAETKSVFLGLSTQVLVIVASVLWMLT